MGMHPRTRVMSRLKSSDLLLEKTITARRTAVYRTPIHMEHHTTLTVLR